VKDNKNNNAFQNHRTNGVYLQFPNGNSISTIWGVGSYTEHHDDDFSEWEKKNDGSNSVEIMIHTDNERLYKRIYKRLKGGEDTVIGWVNITDWVWVVSQLANDKIGYKENLSEG
jgi:hypothetical protein